MERSWPNNWPKQAGELYVFDPRGDVLLQLIRAGEKSEDADTLETPCAEKIEHGSSSGDLINTTETNTSTVAHGEETCSNNDDANEEVWIDETKHSPQEQEVQMRVCVFALLAGTNQL